MSIRTGEYNENDRIQDLEDDLKLAESQITRLKARVERLEGALRVFGDVNNQCIHGLMTDPRWIRVRGVSQDPAEFARRALED